jgi:hypothetical protein
MARRPSSCALFLLQQTGSLREPELLPKAPLSSVIHVPDSNTQ